MYNQINACMLHVQGSQGGEHGLSRGSGGMLPQEKFDIYNLSDSF